MPRIARQGLVAISCTAGEQPHIATPAMLWRLPAPVRSLSVPASRRYTSTAPATVPPLRILFCGSDDFSIASLHALTTAQRSIPNLIHSISVVHRPAKPTGHGLKTLREVPIQHAATQSLLARHVLDTFTGWTPPSPIDLIIAVSFGLFVPPRILALAQYGGLNLHPSLLPDLGGAAPIQHALLKRRPFTGVSVQTLHPAQFDGGLILAQTPAPGIPIPADAGMASLTAMLAQQGADMLVDVLKSRAFVPPLEDVGWYEGSGGPVEHAEKIGKRHSRVDGERTTWDDVCAIRKIANPWMFLPNGHRIILNEVSAEPGAGADDHEAGRGIWVPMGEKVPLVRLACGRVMGIRKCTYEGGKVGEGNKPLVKFLRRWRGGGS